MAVTGVLGTDVRMLVRVSHFRRLLTVRLLSQGADGVYQVALATYVVFSPENETSPGAIAAAMAVLLLPYSLVGPFAGVLLDRWQRRQVFVHGSLLRALLAVGTALLMAGGAPEQLFFASALCVTAVNRFVLAGLSAALPRVVEPDRLVTANSLSPTAGTLAATAGGGLAFVVRLLGADSDAAVVVLAAALYLAAALAALRMGRELLGPDRAERVRLSEALSGTARDLAAGLRHLRAPERRSTAWMLGAVTLMRFCYGALTVMVLMLSRYAWAEEGSGDSGSDRGLALLGLAVGLSGAGFFVAALITPAGTRRLGPVGWAAVCAGGAAVLVLALGLPFAPVPMMITAFMLGLVTQGGKIATDTVVQASVEDRFRGRIFSVYDVLFNVSFVAAAGVAALMLPADGRSVPLLVTVALIYAAIGITLPRFRAQ